jgi:soluble lytic murein transglycosylase-like protein
MRDSRGSRIRQSIDWVEAAADLAGNGLTMLRRLSEAVGTLTVVAAVAIVTMPSVRDSTVQAARSWFASEASALAEAEVDSAAAPGAREAATEPVRWVRLDPTEASVAQYLSRRYHVADGAVRPLVLAARDAGRESQLDPLLILAVMAVESSLNPFAESPVGAQGLMQVMTSVHSTRFGLAADPLNALEPVANIRMGSAILSDAIRRGGSMERGLQLYVGAGNLADDGGYASRVLSEMSRLKLAAAGNVAAALAAGMHSDGKTVGSAAPGASPTPGSPPSTTTASSS